MVIMSRMNNCQVDSGTSDFLVSSSQFYTVDFVYYELGEKLFISNVLQMSEKVIHKILRLKFSYCSCYNLPLASLYYFSSSQTRCRKAPTSLLREFSAEAEVEEEAERSRAPQGRSSSCSEVGEISSEDRNRWGKFVLNLNLRLGVDHYEAFKEKCHKNIPKFKIGDIVLIKDPLFKLSKVKNSGVRGPFIVESRNLSSYLVRNLIDNRPFLRNGRHLRKLVLSDKNSELLKNQQFTIKNDNLISPITEEVEPEEVVVVEGIIRGKNKSLGQSKYNLRSKKLEEKSE